MPLPFLAITAVNTGASVLRKHPWIIIVIIAIVILPILGVIGLVSSGAQALGKIGNSGGGSTCTTNYASFTDQFKSIPILQATLKQQCGNAGDGQTSVDPATIVFSPAGWTDPFAGGASVNGAPAPNVVIVSEFGPRIAPCAACSTFHEGVDLAGACGTPILAVQSGLIDMAGWNGGYGQWVEVNHGGGVSSGYGHMIDGSITVAVGQQVKAGQVIGLRGSTGHSTGCHLHFEIHIDGSRCNPRWYMNGVGIDLGPNRGGEVANLLPTCRKM